MNLITSLRRASGLLLFEFLVQMISSMKAEHAVTQVLDNMFMQYDKAVRPYYGEKPVEVEISVFVLAVSEINEAQTDFTLMMYFRQSWTDPRLIFRPHRGINRNGSNGTVYIDENRAKFLWLPDTFFVNQKKTLRHVDTTVNEFIRVNSNGLVLKSARYTMTLSCPMDLQRFPFDRQVCSMEMESFAGTKNEIEFKLSNDSVGVSREVSMPEFKYIGYKTRTTATGNYSRLTIDFVFQRASGYYILRCYVPIALAAIVSLLSLVLANPVIGPLIHVLNICFVLLYSGQAWVLKSPMISYLKHLDVYLLLCIAHILLCLLGSSYQQRNREANGNTVCSICKPLTELDAFLGNQSQGRNNSKCDLGKIFCCSLMLVLITLFIVSNVLYWSYIGYTLDRIHQEENKHLTLQTPD